MGGWEEAGWVLAQLIIKFVRERLRSGQTRALLPQTPV